MRRRVGWFAAVLMWYLLSKINYFHEFVLKCVDHIGIDENAEAAFKKKKTAAKIAQSELQELAQRCNNRFWGPLQQLKSKKCI